LYHAKFSFQVALQNVKVASKLGAWCRWLTPVILATQEAEIWMIAVRSQPRQIVCEILSQKYPTQNRAGGVDSGVDPEFKPWYCN
jgi:hypothetical protein